MLKAIPSEDEEENLEENELSLSLSCIPDKHQNPECDNGGVPILRGLRQFFTSSKQGSRDVSPSTPQSNMNKEQANDFQNLQPAYQQKVSEERLLSSQANEQAQEHFITTKPNNTQENQERAIAVDRIITPSEIARSKGENFDRVIDDRNR